MSGTPAIDTRSQNRFIKQKQSQKDAKGKANKKAKKNVAVRICRFFFTVFSLYFRIFFALFSLFFRFFPRRVQQKHICRFFFTFFSLYVRFFFSLFVLLCFCFLLCFCIFICFYFAFFSLFLMVGHVWLPSPKINLDPHTDVVLLHKDNLPTICKSSPNH